MANFTEIYTNIAENNVASANKTGSGRFVLQTAPTLTTPTISGNATFDTNTLYIDATNHQVGIGTTSPNALITSFSGSAKGLAIEATTPVLVFSDTDSSNYRTWLANDNGDFYINNRHASGSIIFSTNSGSERMRIQGGGRVGVNTNNPLYDFQVGNTTAIISLGGAPSGNGNGYLKFINSNSVRNWQIGSNNTISGALEFAPSTTNGGDTFSTPIMSLSNGGMAVGGGSVTRKLSLYATSADEQVIGINAATTTGTVRQLFINSNNTRYFEIDGLFTAGSELLLFQSDTSTALGITRDAHVGIDATKRFHYDGAVCTGDTYTSETAANQLDTVVGGTLVQRNTPSWARFRTTLSVPDGAHLSLDDGGDDYFINSANGQNDLYSAGTLTFRTTSAGIVRFQHEISVPDGVHLSLDGGGDDYWVCSANGQNDLYSAGTLALRTNSSGEILLANVNPPTANYANRNGIVKAWAEVGPTGTLSGGYNVTTSRISAGKYRVTFITDFSASDYSIVCSVPSQNLTTSVLVCGFINDLSTSVDIYVQEVSFVTNDARFVDSTFTMMAIGTQ